VWRRREPTEPANESTQSGPEVREGVGSSDRHGTDATRRELLAIQKRLWRRLQGEIEATIEEAPPNLELYQAEFERDVARYESTSSKAELMEAAARADVVFVGDYHTLPQAQRTVVKMLLGLVRARPEIVLCVEMVHAEHQPHLDRYMAGELSDDGFLRALRYDATWGFPWLPYREVFQVARKLGVRTIGINSDPPQSPNHFLERDFFAANLIADELQANPDALVLVFDGDLHVARDHLPLILDTVIQERALPRRRRLIVHQNAEEVYWTLARERREHDINVVRLAKDAFCVLNASPFEKLHSYLNWVGERAVLEPPEALSAWDVFEEDEDDQAQTSDEGEAHDTSDDDDDDDDDDAEVHFDSGSDYEDQVRRIVCTQATFLGIERDDLDAFELFTVNDLDFLDYLESSDRYARGELEDIKRQILSNESYFIPKGDILYLADFSVANAAEEAAHFLHHRCADYDWERPRNLMVDFYLRVVTEVLGFFGSKILVPTRECWTEADCRRYVEHHRVRERTRARKRRAAKSGVLYVVTPDDVPPRAPEQGPAAPARHPQVSNRKVLRQASRLLLHHKRLEREYLATGTWLSAGKCLTQPAEVHLALTSMLGHMMGHRLYSTLLAGLVNKAWVRSLFDARVDRPHVALDVYLRMVRRTAGLRTVDQSRAERL
jgi:Haem-binding uptake, Tiki superfamily, ChaN